MFAPTLRAKIIAAEFKACVTRYFRCKHGAQKTFPEAWAEGSARWRNKKAHRASDGSEFLNEGAVVIASTFMCLSGGFRSRMAHWGQRWEQLPMRPLLPIVPDPERKQLIKWAEAEQKRMRVNATSW